ncbi:DUF736 domain-containing protein [Caulobacter sp. UNC279MFTsu5.1]|uniref:DUF736 domain-containing protein n=1 Tax=Caulobacter sp. UNC279MFTsu5.1 TaxID=1502775 RepID=UPI0008F21464|nr:DUF736 domain-containing protein [Caulobacter sp. UNC279MFTsu5.1]SFI51641.1 Uncharacterized conserved protein, DUF736 family [Caulobacter sp. UNC279MFTsu5.1]
MARIGKFTATADGFTGYIHTLQIRVSNVVFKAIAGDPAKSQPVYRVYADGAEIGSVWKYKSKKGVDFLSVSLDDISFPAAVNARLFPAEDGFDLVWSRPTKRREPEPELETGPDADVDHQA